MEIENVSGNTYYFPGSTAIGMYREGKRVTIIDTGIDENKIRKIFNYIINESLTLENVIISHSHADHSGGNDFLQKRGFTKFFSSEIEAFFLKNPQFFPYILFGSSYPEFLNTKFIVPAKTEHVYPVSSLKNFKIFEFEGHAFGMVVLKTPDNIVFLADTMFSEKIIEKHPIPFHIDTEKYINAMDSAEKIDADGYIISHGGFYKSISDLKKINVGAIEKIIEIIEKNLPETMENLYSLVLSDLKMEMREKWEYFLNRVPFLAILKYMEKNGRVVMEQKENKIFLKIR